MPLYQRVIRPDPNFAMAYADLGSSYSNLFALGLAAENARRAYELPQACGITFSATRMPPPNEGFSRHLSQGVLQAGVCILTCRSCYGAAKLPIKGISIVTMLRAAEPYSIGIDGRCRKCKPIVLRKNNSWWD
jgi:hypothetical protein